MNFDPHPYQRRAVRWVEDHPRCLLFLDMGLGKTVSTLTAIQSLMDWGDVTRVLVIGPKKVAEATWSAEVSKWDHLHLTVSTVTGTAAQRRKALAADADLFVMGRDSVVWLEGECGKQFPFDMVVIDELTSFKNHRSQRFKALRRMTKDVPRIVGLTGTPTPTG